MKLIMRSDMLIWKKFVKGNKKALSHIYHQHVNALYNFGLKYTSDQGLIKDCIQELFLTLINTRESIGKVSKIRAYLFVSLKRSIIHELKKRKRTVEYSPDDQNLPFDIEYSLEEILVNNEIENEKSAELIKALKNLTPRQKEIIYLRFNCNMEYEEICNIMGLTYDSARKLLFRSIKTLRTAYTLSPKS